MIDFYVQNTVSMEVYRQMCSENDNQWSVGKDLEG
jgi:hypothetical protein